jgi:hypothetical protein
MVTPAGLVVLKEVTYKDGDTRSGILATTIRSRESARA